MRNIATVVLLLWGSLCLFPVRSYASDDSQTYDNLLVLPLQHNYYQPLDPRALGQGGGHDLPTGASSVFGNPARMAFAGRHQVILSAAYLSSGHSSLSVLTDDSPALPSTAAGMFNWRAHHFAAGYRRAMDVSINFPDVQDATVIDRAELRLEQLAAGWSFSGIKHLWLGAGLTWTQFYFKWDSPDQNLASGQGSAPSFSAGLRADLGPGVYFSAGFKSKTEMSCYTTYYGDTTDSRLKLAGAMPQIAWVSFSYLPEPGFEASAGMEITGWHLVSQGYLERMDYHLGCSLELIPGRLEAFAGSYSLKHPLDPYLRRFDTHLQDMYFITGGLGYQLGPVKLECSAATSRLLSGKGLNQNLLSAGIVYQNHP